jgi:hypothetical protein
MVMGVLTARTGKNESGSFVPEPPRAHPQSPAMRFTTRPRPSSHHRRLCIFAPFESLAQPELGPNPYTGARIELVDEAEVREPLKKMIGTKEPRAWELCAGQSVPMWWAMGARWFIVAPFGSSGEPKVGPNPYKAGNCAVEGVS